MIVWQHDNLTCETSTTVHLDMFDLHGFRDFPDVRMEICREREKVSLFSGVKIFPVTELSSSMQESCS